MENLEENSYYSAEKRFNDDLEVIFLKALQNTNNSSKNQIIDDELIILIFNNLKEDEIWIEAVNSYLNMNKKFFEWINQSYLRVLEKGKHSLSEVSKEINIALLESFDIEKQQFRIEDAIYTKYYELIDKGELSEEKANIEIIKELQKITEKYNEEKFLNETKMKNLLENIPIIQSQNHRNLDQLDEFVWSDESLFIQWKNKIEEFDKKYGDELMDKLIEKYLHIQNQYRNLWSN